MIQLELPLPCMFRIDHDIDNEGPYCGDEGRLCPSCTEAEGAAFFANYGAYIKSELDKERFAREFGDENQQLRDAGRGHLVRD